MVKGASGQGDVAAIIAFTHAIAIKFSIRWWIEWVASDDNPADAPSRDVLLHDHNPFAVLVLPPRLGPAFDNSAIIALLEQWSSW